MPIRCANCQALVSEWAGWCPSCRYVFDDQDPPGVVDRGRNGSLVTGLRARTPLSVGALGAQGGTHLPRPSPLFARMVALGPVGLGTAIDAWWTAGANDGFVTVRRRLKLGPPNGDESTRWTMDGRFWHSTHLHSVPVVLELWPLYEGYARMTLTPQAHVFASRRYFRAGHRVLDHLSNDLARASSDVAHQ